uniref:ATP citrate synthase n=1 Tax=Macrostomum lignano TaxID=282301 RepID=A0A1I8FBK8_9PLAT
MSDAMRKHTGASVMVNFASLRSAYDSTLEAFAVSADSRHRHHSRGHPGEFESRLALRAAEKSVTVIGRPLSVASSPAASRSANTGGMMDNILNSKLYRPGSVAYVSPQRRHSHLLRYQADPGAQMLVVLGEVGGQEEWRIADALRDGRITKPNGGLVHRTCAGCWALSWRDNSVRLRRFWSAAASLCRRRSRRAPTVPMDYSWARELGLIRKPSSFMTSICDERGQELLYAGVPITEIINRDFGIGGVLSLLWRSQHHRMRSRRQGSGLLPHLRPAVTIDSAALWTAPRSSSANGVDTGLIPMEFVNEMRKRGELIMGIGHRVKNFRLALCCTNALEVEKITTSKKPNLILNVDGMIGVAMVDLLRHSAVSLEADEFIEIGALNGMFVAGPKHGLHRALPGPAQAQTGLLQAPLGRHQLCDAGAEPVGS